MGSLRVREADDLRPIGFAGRQSRSFLSFNNGSLEREQSIHILATSCQQFSQLYSKVLKDGVFMKKDIE